MAVGADRGLQVAQAQHGVMDALDGLGVFIKMTAPAGFGMGYGKSAAVLEVSFRVLGGGETEMAVETAQLGVNRVLQMGLIHAQRYRFSAHKLLLQLMFVAPQAVLLLGGVFFTTRVRGDGMGAVAARADRRGIAFPE